MTAPDRFPELEVLSEGEALYSDIAPTQRVEHDIEYIRRWSLSLDLRIVWLTVFGKGARQNAY